MTGRFLKDLGFGIRLAAVALAGYSASIACVAESATTAVRPIGEKPGSVAAQKRLPRFPFAMVGRVGYEGKLYPVLARDNLIYVVHPGLLLPPDYRMESISDDAIEVTYLPLGRRQRIRLSELRSADKPVSSASASVPGRDNAPMHATVAPEEVFETRSDGTTVRLLIVPGSPGGAPAEAPAPTLAERPAGASARAEVRALPDGTLPAVRGVPDGVLVQAATEPPGPVAMPPIASPVAVEVVTTPGGAMPPLPALPSDVAVREVPPADARQRATIQSQAPGPEVWIVGRPDGSMPTATELPAGARIKIVPGATVEPDPHGAPR